MITSVSTNENILNEKKVLNTRLGTIEYNEADLFYFDNGIYGFHDCKNFILTFLPYEDSPENFRFLQSVEKPDLALIVMNVLINDNSENNLIKSQDLAKHFSQYSLNIEEIAIFLVVAIKDENGKKIVSVNTKAPIILSPHLQKGWQIIIEGEKYQISQTLSE